MLGLIVGVSLAAMTGATAARADHLALEPKPQREWKQAVNAGTVGVLTEGPGCTCTDIAADMAAVLNETGAIRVLPVMGDGSLQGIADVIYLRGIDIGILQADVLRYVKRNGIHSNIEERVRYIARLYDSELHLIAGGDIETIQDLDGRKVSYDIEGKGAFITAENVFTSLDIEVEPVHLERDVAIKKIRQGEIAAALVVTGKPAESLRTVKPGNGLHFIAVPMTGELGDTYEPAELAHEDYPELIALGDVVKTIAVPEVLAVYNWERGHERYAKVSSVIDAFFENFDALKEDVRHPKWREVDLREDCPGWERFAPAQEWLDRQAALEGAAPAIKKAGLSGAPFNAAGEIVPSSSNRSYPLAASSAARP